MKAIVILIAAECLILVVPAFGQIAAPILAQPPCTGDRCFLHPRGATTQHVPPSSSMRQSCPQGTVYDAYKGTCRVMTTAH